MLSLALYPSPCPASPPVQRAEQVISLRLVDASREVIEFERVTREVEAVRHLVAIPARDEFQVPADDEAGMDWRTWFEEGLVDSLSIGRTYANAPCQRT